MDREKVVTDNAVRGLQSAIEISGALVHLRKEHAKAILELLKEQEAIEPKKAPFPDASRANGSWYYICGACSRPIDPIDKYCRECGRPVLWEGR